MVNVDRIGLAGGLGNLDFKRYSEITQVIKTQIVETEALISQIAIPSIIEWYLYGVMVVDSVNASEVQGAESSETGLCFFAGQQIDRSPTGGCVAARMALAHAKLGIPLFQRRAFNSFVSNVSEGRGAFVGANVEEVDVEGGYGLSARGVVARIEGDAFYTGATTFVLEPKDPVREGVSVEAIEQSAPLQ
jgi:trans-L-3-hydroxyproline dehydratase